MTMLFKTLSLVALLAMGSWGADYQSMSTEELMALRGTLPVEERPAFRAEMQKRFKTMTAEERKAYGVGQGLGGQPKGPGYGVGKGMGVGGGRSK